MAEQTMATDLSKQLAEQTFLRARAEMERDELRRRNEGLLHLIGMHRMKMNNGIPCLLGCAEVLHHVAKLEGDAEEYLQELLLTGRHVEQIMSELNKEYFRICSNDHFSDEPVCTTSQESNLNRDDLRR